MVIAHGFSTIMGVGAESTLGTPVAATQQICFISESLSEVIKEVLDSSLCGHAARSIGQPGTKEISGGFVFPWRTGLALVPLQKFFGTFLPDTPNVGQNTYSLDNSIDGDGYTVAIDKQVDVYEFAGYKASTLTITGNPGDGVRIALDGFAISLSLISVLNTSVTLAALSDEGTIILFQDATFRIADLADALQTSDELEISDYNIEVNRQLQPVEVNSHNRTEAHENGFRESTLKFTIPQYQSDFIVEAHRTHTPLQFDVVIVNGSSTKTLQGPKLIVTEYKNNVGGPEFVKLDVTCQIIPDPEGTNAFMTLQNPASEFEIIEE